MKKHCSCCSHCCASFFKRISIAMHCLYNFRQDWAVIGTVLWTLVRKALIELLIPKHCSTIFSSGMWANETKPGCEQLSSDTSELLNEQCSHPYTAQPYFQVVSELLRLNLGVRSSQVTLQATRSDKLATAQRTFLGSRLLVLPPGGQIMSCHDNIFIWQLHLCRTREFLCLNPVPHSGQEKAFSVLCTFICTWCNRVWIRKLKIFSRGQKWSPWCRWPQPCTLYTPIPELLCAAFGRGCKKVFQLCACHNRMSH